METSKPHIHECRRVLVGVDLLERHGFAMPYAYGMIRSGGTVHLLHNIKPIQIANPMIGGYYPEVIAPEVQMEIVAEAENRLRDLEPPEAAERGITTEVEVTQFHSAVEAICAAAERFNADVICVGSHTRPGITAKILGSVSLGVLQHSLRPVLVVWPPTE